MSTSRPPYFQRLARGMVVVAICLSLGLQWAALQGIAWTSMLINYSTKGSFAEAVTKTFDGQHPCPLCKAVETGSEKKQDVAIKAPVKKIDALVTQVAGLIPPAGQRFDYPALRELRAVPRSTPPPEEPPRALTA